MKKGNFDMISNEKFTLNSPPSLLKEKAEEIIKSIVALKASFERIKRLSDASGSYWRGESGDSFREALSDYRNESDEIVLRLEKYISDITDAAGIETADNTFCNGSDTLPPDLLI